ncbi:zinc knuckle CX2CX4HX4C containing protein [Tanacetum coccineum]
MIHNSPIILKKWSMDTRLCKDDLTRIPVWVKIHDVPIQVFFEDGLRIIVSQIDHCPKKVSITPSVVTFNIATPTVEKTNDGFQTVGKKKKKKGKSKSTNGGQFSGQLVKQTVRYEPKATTSAPKKGNTNVANASKSSTMLKTTVTSTMNDNILVSNPYSALDEESEEEVENVYDESANLLQNKKPREVRLLSRLLLQEERLIVSKEGLGVGGLVVVGGRSLRESKRAWGEVGGVEKTSSTGSKFMAKSEECLDGDEIPWEIEMGKSGEVDISKLMDGTICGRLGRGKRLKGMRHGARIHKATCSDTYSSVLPVLPILFVEWNRPFILKEPTTAEVT